MDYTIPTISIPRDRELDAQERRALALEFRTEFEKLNPNPNSLVLNRAVEDFKKQIFQASPALRAHDAEMAKRQAERGAVQREADERRASAEKARVEAENEKLRQEHLATWLSQGGSEEDFVKRWPEMRLRLLEEATLAQRNLKIAKAARTWSSN